MHVSCVFLFYPGSLAFLNTPLSLLNESPTIADMFASVALSRGITAHRISKNATFFMNEATFAVPGCQNRTSERHKPLLLMLPWLGSRPQALVKYCDIYFNTGFDVLVFESEVRIQGLRNWSIC